jgi:hypothetical protein
VDATALMRRRRLSQHEERHGTHYQQCQNPEHLLSHPMSFITRQRRELHYSMLPDALIQVKGHCLAMR